LLLPLLLRVRRRGFFDRAPSFSPHRSSRSYELPSDRTCREVVESGQCGEPWLINTVAEVPSGFCQTSCGRCPCCRPALVEALSLPGGPAFVAAAEAAGLAERWSMPGWTGTLLVPAGGSDPIVAAAVVARHALAPMPVISAPWTAPFLVLPGAEAWPADGAAGGSATPSPEGDGRMVVALSEEAGAPTTTLQLLGGGRDACRARVEPVSGWLSVQ